MAQATNGKNALVASGLNTKAVTGVTVTQNGSVVAIEIAFSGGSKFIKVKHGEVEVGGSNEWGSGTAL